MALIVALWLFDRAVSIPASKQSWQRTDLAGGMEQRYSPSKLTSRVFTGHAP
jgi:hypothetical protein